MELSAELDHHQHIARTGHTNHHRAQPSLLRTRVEERQVALNGPIANEIANGIARFRLQVTGINIEHLIPKSRDVEAGTAALLEGFSALELRLGQPFIVGKAEL